MDVNDLIDQCRLVKGAVTIWNVMDLLEIEQEVFILANTSKNLAVIRGKVIFLQYVDTDSGEQDVRLTLEFRGTDNPVIQTLLLGSMLNGYSRFIGDEDDANFARLFTDVDHAVQYFELVQYVRDIFTLERSSNVNSLISRLLSQQKKPKPDR